MARSAAEKITVSWHRPAARTLILLGAVVAVAWVLPLGFASPEAVASPSTPTVTPVLSQYENASRAISRDDGLSVALPNGKDLWLFGDTEIFTNNGFGPMVPNDFISGDTAAEGPFVAGQVPISLMEVPGTGQPPLLSAVNPPTPILPTPTDVYLPDGSGGLCTSAPGRYSARWITGAAVIPNTSDVLITYSDVCVTGPWRFQGEGWGFAEYNWDTNALDVAPDDVLPPSPSGAALAPSLELGSPVFNNGQVWLFSFDCTSIYVGCNAGQVYAATLAGTVSALSNPASYAVNPVATDGSSDWQPLGMTVASYPDAPLRMIETTSIAGTYNVMTASTPTGPWHLETTGVVPRCQGLSAFCYGLIGHPELSTSSQLIVTYYDPGAGPPGPTGPIGHLLGVGTSYTEPVPNSPDSLSALGNTTSAQPTVQLQWSPPSNGTSGVTYNIYRSTTSGKEQSYFAAPIATGVTGTSYTDSGLVTGTTYYYVVSATNALGFEGVASAEASATAWNCTAYTSLAFGSRQVCGGIRAEYQALGGPSGFLGYPITDEIGTPDGVGRFNHFQYGSIYWTAWTGAHEVHGAIRAVWAALGWERGVLGYPLTDETMTPDWVGRYNHFAGGSIYWTPQTGAWEVQGAIRQQWAGLGWERSVVGYPITDETGTPDGIGRFNHFQYGSIYWTAGTGAHEVHGAIRAVWAALGWERSVLGYPLTDETMTPDWVGRYNHFAGGSIYWTPSTGAHEVQGGIRAVWASLGWERSFLGYPVSDEYTAGFGIRRSDFQHGSITWNVPTGQWSVIRH